MKGELRAEEALRESYHIIEKEKYYRKKADGYYRHNCIYRKITDKKTGEERECKLLLENNAKVMYDEKFIDVKEIKEFLV